MRLIGNRRRNLAGMGYVRQKENLCRMGVSAEYVDSIPVVFVRRGRALIPG
jgi:hypothetical protein